MRTHRFGRKLKLPATIAIKHQIRMRMAQYEIKKAEAEARAEAFRRQPREELLVKHGELHVFFDVLQTAHANTEAVHVAPQHTPYRQSFGASGEYGRGGNLTAVIGQGRVAR